MTPRMSIVVACFASLASGASGIKTHGLIGRREALAGHSQVANVTNWPNPADPNAQPNPAQKLMMAVAPQWWVEQQGGYDLLLGAVRYFYGQELLANTEAEKEHFATTEMHAWIAMSDQSHTQKGAAALCNYGGPGQGVQFMLDQMKAHKPGKALFVDHLSIAYEIMQCINGCLMWDKDSDFAYSQLLAKG